MTKRWILAALVPAALFSVGAAEAQTITSPYRFVDTRHGFHAYPTYVFTDRGVIDIGPGSAPGAAIGYAGRISGPFGVDVRLFLLPTSRRVYGLSDPQPDAEEIHADPMAGLEQIGTADMLLTGGDASLRFDITGPRTWYRLQPYALIGAGVIIRAAEDRSIEEDADIDPDLHVRFQSNVTGNVGAGIEWHATDRFTVRLDARNLLWRVHVPTGFRTGARVLDDRQWVQTGHLGIGFGFRL